MNDFRKSLIKNSKLSDTSTLSDSIIFTKKDMIPTTVPMINVALSGSVDGGLIPGLTMLAGPSKHFKTCFALLLGAAFLEKYPDGTILFYDSEFGTPESYFNNFEIDKSKVVHCPIMNIEDLKFDIVSQLDKITRKDEVMIIIDSVGNLASKKEIDDAMEGKSVADMTRAKQLKSLFRMITPHLTMKGIPCVVVNHTYKTLDMYPKDVVGGGTGSYYSANDIWIIGRQQEKEKDEKVGFNYVVRIEKSRLVKEDSKIPITVTHAGGISRYSGLFDIALEGNFIVSPTKGWYSLVNRETGEVLPEKFRAAEVTKNAKFWKDMFTHTDFKEYITSKYRIKEQAILADDVEEEV